MSVVVVGRSDATRRSGPRTSSRAQIWRERDGFVYTSAPLADSVAQARALQAQAGGRPVLLLDHGDNVMSGGTCDTTDVLEECLRQGLSNIGVGPLCDPGRRGRRHQGGPWGDIGHRAWQRACRSASAPIRAAVARSSASVRAITDGRFRITGPIYTGETWAMGRTAVLETDDVHRGGDRTADGAARPRRLHQRGRRSDALAYLPLRRIRCGQFHAG